MDHCDTVTAPIDTLVKHCYRSTVVYDLLLTGTGNKLLTILVSNNRPKPKNQKTKQIVTTKPEI